jgi:hypothetical protein
MAAPKMASLPPTPTTTTATLALPQTRMGRQGGGHAVTRIICHCHGLCCWRHLCLHLQDNGAKDNGCGDRRGCCVNNRGREEVGHHDPIGMEEQKQQQKQKTKTKTETKSTTVAAMSQPLHLQTAMPVLLPLMPLRKQRQQQQQHGGSNGSSSSRAVAATAYYFELPRSFTASGIKFPFLIR